MHNLFAQIITGEKIKKAQEAKAENIFEVKSGDIFKESFCSAVFIFSQPSPAGMPA